MTGFIFGLILGGCAGLILAALLGAAGRSQHDQDLQVAYRDGYLAALEHHHPPGPGGPHGL
ncbi:MAG: hypothetical protein PHZ19_07995 [Candidatus Thermoplasmatota archaeon]|nr:hypothetical protein [Candidatus Thermoplasmatota archaeon]